MYHDEKFACVSSFICVISVSVKMYKHKELKLYLRFQHKNKSINLIKVPPMTFEKLNIIEYALLGGLVKVRRKL